MKMEINATCMVWPDLSIILIFCYFVIQVCGLKNRSSAKFMFLGSPEVPAPSG
ncbi:hypothetical protein PSDVSF_21750 [Pseudodesulfovibrio sediminis]|uniref:Uncharacterized protein n=1 Tax=Pseudodesulfovibrio sediminis TaxID=2810563 RepID=A0ABN6EVR4_9BACT|nr:hypothetical protein PSDVSF_21750 [Pseudodesulfovibrio sediminis]